MNFPAKIILGLGIRSEMETKLYGLWESALKKLKPTMEPIGIAEWLLVILKHDKSGKIRNNWENGFSKVIL